MLTEGELTYPRLQSSEVLRGEIFVVMICEQPSSSDLSTWLSKGKHHCALCTEICISKKVQQLYAVIKTLTKLATEMHIINV
uniref:Uncharacterized protein n=1 Tax=Arundo donax TaxID=35708 RepID=A0A0A9CZP8_ARUDO